MLRPKARGLVAAWLVLSATSGCASGPELDRGALPSVDDYVDEPIVVLRETNHVELFAADGEPRARSVYRRRILITSPKGSDRGDYGTSYDLEFGRIESAAAVVHRPDGSVETHPTSDWADHPYKSGYSVYDNNRVLSLDLPELPVGTVVDVEIVRLRTRAHLLAQRFGFGGRAPHLWSEFEVRAPAGWSLAYRTQKTGELIDFPPDFAGEDGDATVLRWTRSELKPVPWEPYGPPASDLLPFVAVQVRRWTDGDQVHEGLASWSDYALYLSELQHGTAEPTPEIEAIVSEVLSDAPPDPYAKAARLYGWVQENIRYVSIQVGMGGWRPYPAAEVMKNRFGDCKDKATLLKSMLAVAGIESRLASLYSHRGIPREFVLPNLGFTNHAILAIELPDGRVIVDPTERTVPFGALPLRDQEAPLLLVGSEEEPIVRTAASSPDDNARVARLGLAPAGVGNWSGRVEVSARGGIAAELHRRLLGQSDDMDDHITSYANITESSSGEPTWSVADGESGDITASVDVEFRQIGSKVGDRWLLRPSDLLGARWSDLEPGPRETPVLIKMRRTLTEVVEFDLDGGTVRRLPEPVEAQIPHAAYRLAWEETSSGVRLTRTLRLLEPRVEPEAYETFMTFLRTMRAAEASPALVTVGAS